MLYIFDINLLRFRSCSPTVWETLADGHRWRLTIGVIAGLNVKGERLFTFPSRASVCYAIRPYGMTDFCVRARTALAWCRVEKHNQVNERTRRSTPAFFQPLYLSVVCVRFTTDKIYTFPWACSQNALTHNDSIKDARSTVIPYKTSSSGVLSGFQY